MEHKVMMEFFDINGYVVYQPYLLEHYCKMITRFLCSRNLSWK